MSRNFFAILLAVYTCLGWGLIVPMVAKMSQHMGDKFHPLLPFFWNTLGQIFFTVVILCFTKFAPIKVWTWHWSGWVIFLFWSSASIAVVFAFSLAPKQASVLNAVAAAYPFVVSAPILWLYFGDTMSLQKIVGLLGMMVFMLVAAFG